MLQRHLVLLLLVIVSIGDYMTTQYANASYQEVIDLHTESDRVSIVGIHTPCSDTPYEMLKGFWTQFRKFRYNGCSMSLVPAAMLPADPLQVSYDAGEPTIDPRDMLNPIMFHGCHGDDMGAILNDLYTEPVSGTGQVIDTQLSDSTDHNLGIQRTQGINISDVFEQLYYRALTDKTWLKAHPQRGFRKSGLHPMIYSVASTFQIGNLPISSGSIYPNGVVHDDDTGEASTVPSGVLGNVSSGNQLYDWGEFGRPTLVNDGGSFKWVHPMTHSGQGFLTPRLQRLGWMDTRQVVGVTSAVEKSVTPGVNDTLPDMYFESAQKLAPVLTPKLFMGMLLLPPAYKTEQHFRLILNHSFSFAKFRGASMQYDSVGFLKKAYPYFDFSGEADSRKIDPAPEPEPKGDNDDADGLK